MIPVGAARVRNESYSELSPPLSPLEAATHDRQLKDVTGQEPLLCSASTIKQTHHRAIFLVQSRLGVVVVKFLENSHGVGPGHHTRR